MWLRRSLLIAVWTLSLVGAAQWGARAQSRQAVPPDMLISGDNMAFKPTSTRDGMIFGTVQVRVNGEWRGVVVVDAGPPRSMIKPVPLR
jgi:hypothetical protein